MTLALVFSLLFIVLIGYGLQRNERRQASPKPPLAGSTDVPDRDLQRTRAELTALSEDETTSRGDADVRAERRHVRHGVVALH